MVYGAVHISINSRRGAVFGYMPLRQGQIAMNITQDPHTLLPLPENGDTLIRRNDVPRYLPIATQTLARWAVEGQGPCFIKLGRRLVAYRAGDLREWLQGQVRENTIST